MFFTPLSVGGEVADEENMSDEVKNILLNDWGCAVEIGKEVAFSGALHYAPDRILEHLSEYSPMPSDDLVMVVRCVFQRMAGELFENVRSEQDPAAILTFWRYHMSSPFWQRMLDLALKSDYDGLKIAIQDYLPV